MTHVLIAGVSTRAAGAAAARAGFAVTTIDAYADRDQDPRVRALSLPRDFGLPFSAAAAAAAAATIPADAVAYLSNFDNDPDGVAMLAAGRTLWGNPPDVLRRVRDPFQVAAAFRAHSIPVPLLRKGANHTDGAPDSTVETDAGDPNDGQWLVKPLRSGGGHGIRPWAGELLGPGFVLQQRIDGVPASVVFAAAGGRGVPLAVTRQLIGDARFGASGFQYCGNILSAADPGEPAGGSTLARQAHRLAEAAASHFGLLGVNCIDCVLRNGQLYPVEINPRWSASMELVEMMSPVNCFSVHAAGCVEGRLPAPLPRPRRSVGKAIVFARRDVIVGDTDRWLDEGGIRDVPHTGEAIAAGSPICTLIAEADDPDSCYSALADRARRLYEELAPGPLTQPLEPSACTRTR